MENKGVKYNYQLKCITCGKVFYSNRSTAKYCCSFCKNQQQRIQKGEKIRFSEDGLIITKTKQYEKRKPIDKFAIPKDAKSSRFTYYHKHDDKTAYDIECAHNYDNEYKNDVLQHIDQGYYIYEKRKDYNRYRLVKRIAEKAIEEDWIKNKPEYLKHQRYKVELIVYEWDKKVYKNNGENKRYYDREFEVVDF